MPVGLNSSRVGAVAIACLIGVTVPLAQQPASDATQAKTRVDDRLKALRQEADRLAAQAKTLVVEVRKLEVERDIRAAEAREAERSLAAAKEELNNTTARLALLEDQRQRGLPDL